jgi:hypothetical protein
MLSAPTISPQLRRLEKGLGEELLIKSGRRLVPTEVGRFNTASVSAVRMGGPYLFRSGNKDNGLSATMRVSHRCTNARHAAARDEWHRDSPCCERLS